MKKEYIIALCVTVFAVLVGGYFVFNKKDPAAPSGGSASTTAVTTITGGGYAIEQLPVDDIRKLMPSLTRTVAYGAGVTPEVKAIVEKSVAELALRLQKDPTQASDWLNLGVMYHAVNDYRGAEEVWIFLTKVIPTDTTAYDNLGKLYHFDLKDFPKAEQYFKRSIAIASTSTTPYIELFTLYRYSYKKDTSAAADTLMAWAKAIPESVDPYFSLGLYYRDQGRTAEAKEALTHAMDMARSAGDVELMAKIGPELQKLLQ
jgi:tetratricopeptide (TPR) repeat protein